MSYVLQKDTSILLRYFPLHIIDICNWDMSNPIEKWSNIEVVNNRIIKMCLSSMAFTLRFLIEIKFPDKLEYLNLANNSIYENLNRLILPHSLKYLNLSGNIITDDGLSQLKLPYNLEVLKLSDNSNLTKHGLLSLILPPKLKLLELNNLRVKKNVFKLLILPDSIERIDIFDSLNGGIFNDDFDISIQESEKLIKYAKSEEGIQKYFSIKKNYMFQILKQLQKEICRGLIYGETEDPIFRFLQNHYELRKNILTFFNPFV